MTTRIDQVKINGKTVSIAYSGSGESVTLTSEERPRPELLRAYQAVGDLTLERAAFYDFRDELALSCIALGDDHVKSTWTLAIEDVTKFGKLTLPPIGIGETAKGDFGKVNIALEDAEVIDELRRECIKYINGDREQAALPLGEEGEG